MARHDPIKKESKPMKKSLKIPTEVCLKDVPLEDWDQVFAYVPESDLMVIHTPYPYEVNLGKLHDWRSLLGCVLHLSVKTWTQPGLLREFVRRVCAIKGWEYPWT